MSNYNKGAKYLFAGNYKKALQFFKKEELDFKEKYLNMGNCYRYLDDYAMAEKCYIKANREDMPAANGTYQEMYPYALSNLGLLEYARGNDDLAISYYKTALSIDPLYYDALWNLGNATLRKYFSSEVGNADDWKLGWTLYDYRFKRSNGAVRIDKTFSTWDGVSTDDEIVVLTEQGLGDKIMFGRYIKCLYRYFKKVYVQCHPSLDIFFSDFEIVREPDVKMISVPICSLAGHFGMVDERWLDGKFKSREFEGFNIGCVWSGSKTHANDMNRSCNSSYFSSLSEFGNLYGLNPDAAEVKGIKKIGTYDWSETAANILGMDLVISVDTSIVHLCGTLGVPCLMLQPLKETDFRWGLGHTDTPWYKSVVIINNNGSWDAVFAEVRKILECIKK